MALFGIFLLWGMLMLVTARRVVTGYVSFMERNNPWFPLFRTESLEFEIWVQRIVGLAFVGFAIYEFVIALSD